MYNAKIIADSISPNNVRLTTVEIILPRIVLAEANTHRMFSRNSASSRAIPVKKMLKMVKDEPYIPSEWGLNKKGMQATKIASKEKQAESVKLWLEARDAALDKAEKLMNVGIHKQITNRLLEPFLWHTVIITATEWSNFFNLRNNKDAHPDIRLPASLAQEVLDQSTPKHLNYGEWHLPLIFDKDIELMREMLCNCRYDSQQLLYCLVKISCARCARISYLTHDGKRDLKADLDLYDRLVQPGHLSPLEHAARPMTVQEIKDYRLTKDNDDVIPFCGNFKGWIQHRKMAPGESDILSHKEKNI